MRALFVGWIMICAFTAWGSESLLSSCRALHFSPTVKENIERGIQRCSIAANDAVIRAYQGSFQARMAEFSINPYTKLSHFNDGRDLLESAVAEAPKNPEIRFVRLSVQLKAPGFLGYNDHIESDVAFVVGALQSGWLAADASFKVQVVDFLLEHAELDPSVRKKLTQLKRTP